MYFRLCILESNFTILLFSCKYAISTNLFMLDLDSYYGPKEDRHFSDTRSQLDVGF